MSLIDHVLDRTATLTDATSDRLNPILVKETRQATQSMLFSTIFLLFIAFSWLVLVLGTLALRDSLETRATAEVFFGWNFAMLSFAIFVVVPFGCFRSLLAERELHTYDLLRITALTPRQIVRGKLSTSVLQIVVYYSAIAPFIAFTSFLQGFDVAWISWVLVMSFLWSVALCVGALAAGVSTRQNQWQSANMVGLILMLLIGWGIALSFALAGRRAVEFDNVDFWWINASVLLIAISYVILAGQVIVARLTFASGNRSTGIRVVLVTQFWLAVAVVCLMAVLGKRIVLDDEFQVGTGIAVLIHWTVAGLILATESDFLSRRIRRRLPGNRLLRLLVVPFLPGGATATLLVFSHLLLIGLGLLVFGVNVAGIQQHEISVLALSVILLNVIIWVGIASIMGRWCRKLSYRFTPAAVRVLTIILFAVVTLLSHLPSMVAPALAKEMIWSSALSPFSMIDIVVTNRRFDYNYVSPTSYWLAWSIVIGATLLVIVMNLPAMFTTVSRIVRDPGPDAHPGNTQSTPQPPPEASFDA